jgi:hypothetical protein
MMATSPLSPSAERQLDRREDGAAGEDRKQHCSCVLQRTPLCDVAERTGATTYLDEMCLMAL